MVSFCFTRFSLTCLFSFYSSKPAPFLNFHLLQRCSHFTSEDSSPSFSSASGSAWPSAACVCWCFLSVVPPGLALAPLPFLLCPCPVVLVQSPVNTVCSSMTSPHNLPCKTLLHFLPVHPFLRFLTVHVWPALLSVRHMSKPLLVPGLNP